MGKEGNIIELIRRCGGEISLSLLKRRYQEVYGGEIGVPKNAKLRDWIQTFSRIRVKQLPGGNDHAAYEITLPSLISNSNLDDVQAISMVQEQKLVKLIRDSGGEISLSDLRFRYKEAYGEAIDCPKKKLREWVQTSTSIGTRRLSERNDTVAFEKPLHSSRNSNNDITDIESVESFSAGGEEPQVDCDAIVSKLMNYVEGHFKPTVVHQESLPLLNILPMEWSDALNSIGMEQVSDISLDIGRRPYCWQNYQRRYLCEFASHIVQDRDLKEIVSNLQDFGDDNRAGIDGQLHRISCIRDNRNKIIGLTIRVGRHVEGNADMIRDLLEETDKSILLLGEPGSGKTTIVRDVTKVLSQKNNVFVVDTSNEIAGDGAVPHPCIGDARRMMVQSLPKQADVMIECVQNHTPAVMVIDEIGRTREVFAAQTSKNRGVRMIASAHGDLRSLMRNKDLRGLIGGLETVTLGDAEAKELQKKTGSKTIQKSLTKRSASPIFDVIIELKRNRLHEWHVVTNVGKAVDDILLGEKYDIQKRMRCMNSGRIFVERATN